MIKKRCLFCKKLLIKSKYRNKFCSRNCFVKARKIRGWFVCPEFVSKKHNCHGASRSWVSNPKGKPSIG